MISDGDMVIEWDVPITVDDGLTLRADVYRPTGPSAVPAILSYGPYGKSLHFQDGQPYQWERMSTDHPDTVAGSSNRFQSWELVDPEKWVPHGYAVVRVDSRGAGQSPGVMNLLSPRETKDFADCIEWVADQSWCTGRVGLNGISYYAMNAWQVASLQPPHLAAICLWEGASDLYREMAFHGGIWNTFNDVWFPGRVVPRQHGMGSRTYRSRLTGRSIAGPTLPDEMLAASRVDFAAAFRSHPLYDSFWETVNPDLSKVDVPLLSAGNWGGAGLHLRGNVEGFLAAASTNKWLELHGLEHWTHFYTDYGVELQREFFDHFLRDVDNGWDQRPPVLLNVRKPGDEFEQRAEQEWPLARTRWTPLYLDTDAGTLEDAAPAQAGTATYDPLGDGVTFLTAPLDGPTELTGPAVATVYISSDSNDADIFVVLRAFTADLTEITFRGSNAPHAPLGLGWLRASHRELDIERSTSHRPVHTHRATQELTPGEVYRLDVEILPTSVILPAGARIGVSIRGRDYVWPGADGPSPVVQGHGATAGGGFTGVGPFRHTHPEDRPADTFGAAITLHAGPEYPSHIVLPVIPDQ